MKTYKTILNREIDLSGLSKEEREVLEELLALYKTSPEWKDFTNKRNQLVRGVLKSLPVRDRQKHPLYRTCQDMDMRLGIAHGIVAPPDYRDYIAAAIEEKYGSRYCFCKETGISQSLLSQVFSGGKDFSLSKLREIASLLKLRLALLPEESPGQSLQIA